MKPKKVTLEQECTRRLDAIREQKWQERQAKVDATHAAEEEEMMALMYGPAWRTRTDLPE